MQTQTDTPGSWRLDLVVLPIIVGLGFLAGLIEAARSPDPAMVVQGWTFAAAMAAVGCWYLWMYASRKTSDDRGPYTDSVIKAGVIASVFWGIAGMLVGLIIALQLSFPNQFYFPDWVWSSFGRLRPLHTTRRPRSPRTPRWKPSSRPPRKRRRPRSAPQPQRPNLPRPWPATWAAWWR